MTRACKLACAIAVVGSLAGCAMFVGKAEYRDYRAVRMASSDEARLLAMQRYVARHPQGRWSQEVELERKARELTVFERGKSTRRGLDVYLTAYPDGTFAAQARERLFAFDQIEQHKKVEAETARRLDEERVRRYAELRRTWVTRFSTHWLRTLLGLSGFGSPIAQLAQANPEFSRAFGRAPRPQCSSDECVKYYESPYAVPVPSGTRIERVMRVILRLRMDGGRVKRAELLLPSWGFSRWRELEAQRAVIDGDGQDRSAAVEWALSQLRAVLAVQPGAHKPEPGYVLAPIVKIAIGSSGEGTDTTAQDPGAPVMHGNAQAPTKDPSATSWTEPSASAAPPDLELEAVQIDKSGRARPAEMALEPVVVPRTGEEMVLETVQVPGASSGGASAQAAAGQGAPAPAAPLVTVTPARVEATRIGALRVVLFSAASDAPAPAYDGLVIELP